MTAYTRLHRWAKEVAHRRGWLASPTLAFAGVPFGPGRRDLAGEVMAAVSGNHDPDTCPVCTAPND